MKFFRLKKKIVRLHNFARVSAAALGIIQVRNRWYITCWRCDVNDPNQSQATLSPTTANVLVNFIFYFHPLVSKTTQHSTAIRKNRRPKYAYPSVFFTYRYHPIMSTYAQVAASGPPQSEAEVSKKKRFSFTLWYTRDQIADTLAVCYRRLSLPEKNVTVWQWFLIHISYLHSRANPVDEVITIDSSIESLIDVDSGVSVVDSDFLEREVITPQPFSLFSHVIGFYSRIHRSKPRLRRGVLNSKQKRLKEPAKKWKRPQRSRGRQIRHQARHLRCIRSSRTRLSLQMRSPWRPFRRYWDSLASRSTRRASSHGRPLEFGLDLWLRLEPQIISFRGLLAWFYPVLSIWIRTTRC